MLGGRNISIPKGKQANVQVRFGDVIEAFVNRTLCARHIILHIEHLILTIVKPSKNRLAEVLEVLKGGGEIDGWHDSDGFRVHKQCPFSLQYLLGQNRKITSTPFRHNGPGQQTHGSPVRVSHSQRRIGRQPGRVKNTCI